MIVSRTNFFKKTLLLILLPLFLLLLSPTLVGSEEYSEYSNQLLENLAQQAELQGKINAAINTERDLASQIAFMDNQIKLTELKIVETDTNIKKLAIDVDNLVNRLGKLQVIVDNLTEVSNSRLRLMYQQSFTNQFSELLLASNGLDGYIRKSEYLAQIRKNDLEVLQQLSLTKTNYNDQKTVLSEKKQQQEDLKNKSIAQKASLGDQKKQKDELLKVTKNNEANYREELNRLKADAAAIAAALSNVGVKIGDVKKGELIAIQGNTGCVAPPPPGGHHLHFEAYKNAKVVGNSVVDINTGKSIQFQVSDHLINPRTYIDSGQWAKPLAIYPNNVTTEFLGASVFGTPHTGIDIAGPVGSPVFAVDNGVAYLTGGSVCDSMMGYKPGTTTPGRGRLVDHQNGMVTLYWHTSN